MTHAPLATADLLLEPLGRGMTPVQHVEHYGYDLSWVQLRGSHLHCSSCGDRLNVPSTSSWADKRLLCEGFIHDHAGCVRIAAKPRRA